MNSHRLPNIVTENLFMQITPHFTLKELTTSQTAEREGLDNTPPPEVVSNLCLLCQALEEVRALFASPIIISSGYRCPTVNARVGGGRNSQHISGLAADFTVIGVDNREVVRRVSESAVAFDQLILEFDRWVHLSVSAAAPRREVLTIRKGTGYLPGLQ